MSYELEKELGIQKALVADLGSKLSNLNVELDFTKQERAGFKEKLIVAESVYKDKLRNLTLELNRCHQYRREVEEKWRQEEAENEELQSKQVALIQVLNEQIANQNTVIQDLTNDLTHANRDVGKLEDKLEKLKNNSRILNKLETVLETFE